MLKKVILQNFRGFRNHTVPLRSNSIAVGINNAGKSTIVEALRLVSIVVGRAKYINFFPVPSWLDIPLRNRGVSPSLSNIDFDFRNSCYLYGDSPAIITAIFENGQEINIYVNAERESIFSVITNSNGTVVKSKAQVNNAALPRVYTLPPIGPLSRKETILAPVYLRKSMWTNLAPLHFRNQLNLLYNHYRDFVRLSENSWKNLQIRSFEGVREKPGSDLSLLVRDGRFVAEVGWVGHGLQAWLQIMWFLSRIPTDSTVILDEPDLYLHADMQRKLIRLLKNRHTQVIVATHSIEIMSEVDPECILIVDKDRANSRFATSLPMVQKVIDNIGAVHNLQLSRLWFARRCLLIEGDDIKFLKIFQDKLFPDSTEPFDALPVIAIEGWGGWKNAVGVSMGLKNAGDQEIKTYCILDSDYHTPEEIAGVKREARKHSLKIHIWKKKEIENYLIASSAIQRLIDGKLSKRKRLPTISQIEAKIDEVCERYKIDTSDAIAQEVYAQNRKKGLRYANRVARERINKAWKTLGGRCGVVSGKTILRELSSWSKNNFNVSFGRLTLARELSKKDIAAEVVQVITRIENIEDL